MFDGWLCELGPVSLSQKAPFCKTSLCFNSQAKRLNDKMIRSLWNLTGLSRAVLQGCLSSIRVNGQLNPQVIGWWEFVIPHNEVLELANSFRISPCVFFEELIGVSMNCIHHYATPLIYFLLNWFSARLANSSPPTSAAYMYQWTRSALVQVIACHLFGAKPLAEPKLDYCQLDSLKQISMKFESEFYHFHSTNAFEIVVCQNGGHFVQGKMS